MRRIIPLLVLLLTLACALPAEPVQKTATPPASTATDTPQPPPSPTDISHTAPAPTATAADPQEACQYPLSSYGNTRLPDLSKVRWEKRPDGSRRLSGLEYPARTMIASPDGAHLAVTFELGNESQMPIEATALLDTQGGEHRWLSTGSRAYEHLYRWLPDGRLLWLDAKGDVYVNDRHLQPPVPMWQINAVAGDIAFLSPDRNNWKGSDWRVDMAAKQWEALTTVDDDPAGMLVGISADGSYALTAVVGDTQGGLGLTRRLWRLPIFMGGRAQPLFDFQVNPLGTDAYISSHTSNLAGTTLWNLGGLYTHQVLQQQYTVTGVLLGLDLGNTLEATDLGLDPKYAALGQDISPDGKWLEVDLTDNMRLPENSLFATVDHVYLTSGSAAGGTLITGHTFQGWSAHAAILQDNKTGELVLSPLPPDGSTIPLPDAAAVVSVYAPWEVAAPSYVLAQPPGHPDQVQRYDEGGKMLGLLDLSPEFNRVFPWWTAVSRQAIYFSVAQAMPHGDTCAYAPAIVEWNLGP